MSESDGNRYAAGSLFSILFRFPAFNTQNSRVTRLWPAMIDLDFERPLFVYTLQLVFIVLFVRHSNQSWTECVYYILVCLRNIVLRRSNYTKMEHRRTRSQVFVCAPEYYSDARIRMNRDKWKWKYITIQNVSGKRKLTSEETLIKAIRQTITNILTSRNIFDR